MLSMLNETYAALTAACTGEINPGNSITQQVLVSLSKFSLNKYYLKFIQLSYERINLLGVLAPDCDIQAFGKCVAESGIDPGTLQKKYNW